MEIDYEFPGFAKAAEDERKRSAPELVDERATKKHKK